MNGNNSIENVVIVGMGALGLMFGERIAQNIGREHLRFFFFFWRRQRHADDLYTINGNRVSFQMTAPDEAGGSADLVVVATKYSGLHEARDLIQCAVNENTTIVSLLNGISSEDILAEVFPREQILDCVAIGMDAVREKTALTYQNMGSSSACRLPPYARRSWATRTWRPMSCCASTMPCLRCV